MPGKCQSYDDCTRNDLVGQNKHIENVELKEDREKLWPLLLVETILREKEYDLINLPIVCDTGSNVSIIPLKFLPLIKYKEKPSERYEPPIRQTSGSILNY
ncbi:hypothetical protein NPIL_551061 [Nephila pilipes]|uniref:Uncharacterized protein n=1 Tax=Nephila pilipes TaxID=299642 RepID=A0A8X6MXE0_NEPPI|nr:hypothetical protein NPIL_551061 [Nephila pilipes]